MLRPYQVDLKASIYAAWAQGARNVLGVAPTGSGKTVLFSNIIAENRSAAVAIAHRSELVSQMSLALARNNVRHKVIGTSQVARNCSALHLAVLGRNYIEPNSRIAVASVDTLIRKDARQPWYKEVSLWITDEAGHLLSDNKWGDAVEMFPNARGLGVTATPCRADGRGLGRHADGVMDAMVLGPTMRELIDAGYLSDYRIFAPPSDIDLSQVNVTGSGDYSPPKLATAVHKSRIVGDIVEHYKRIASGKLGVTFAVDVESATEIAIAYRMAGVPAEVISAKTPDLIRANILKRFRDREIHQLVSVDIFSEGFDLPAIEVVSMGRPTQSYALYVQQFGRGVRILEGKDRAIIIDHVGNTLRHGLPDAPRVWTLDRREKRSRAGQDDAIPLRVCAECLSAYERILGQCPYCGTTPEPATRSTVEAVDGDLHEMSAELLARLRGQVAMAEATPAIPYGATPEVIGAKKKQHRERMAAQLALKYVMALWGGWQTMIGRSESEQQRLFYLTFGIDVLSAQALNRADSAALATRVKNLLDSAGIIAVDEAVNNG